MKKILVFVLVLALALTMGIIAFAEGASEDKEIVAEETVEAVEEPAAEPVEDPAEAPAEEPVEEPAEEPAEEPTEESLFEACGDLYQYWVEGEPAAIDFQNMGTKDIAVEYFFEYAVYTPVTDWAGYDPNTTPPHEMIGQETITFVVPAGETVRVSLTAELDAASDIGRNGYLSVTYVK